jgi:cytochrome c biogenesis protein CcdA/thiol-disulfide isomerase/thioredoxin
MFLLALSFLAGVLTILAPCSFMLLPVIIGGSIGQTTEPKPGRLPPGVERALLITLSLAASLSLFTILLKILSLSVNIDPLLLSYFSGLVLIILGLISLFPQTWDKFSASLGLATRSDKLLERASKQSGAWGSILTGAALGPVFSSCSPTYAYILTTVLRENLAVGLANMLSYIIGLSLVMLGAGLVGQSFVRRLRFAMNPQGIFKRAVAVIFILVGIALITGQDKVLQANFAPASPFSKIEQNLLGNVTGNNTQTTKGQTGVFNVNPPVKAPEIIGIDQWINSTPQTIEGLKGKVVLVDFWTYSCINCLRTNPYLNRWYDAYKDQGFVILGIHAPEFAFEKNKTNVQKAVDETYRIKYPVGLDNDLRTWDAFKNQFWPAKYLIDKDGNLRYTHFGEGGYEDTELAIRTLLEQEGQKLPTELQAGQVKTNLQAGQNQTPETYLGWSRSTNFADTVGARAGQTSDFSCQTNKLNLNQWCLEGRFLLDSEFVQSTSTGGKLILKFAAKEVYLVMGSEPPATLILKLNGQPVGAAAGDDIDEQGKIKVGDWRMYKLIKFDQFETDQLLEIETQPGVKLNVFTFGS